MFLVLGWGLDLSQPQGPPGLTSLLMCLWALPVAVLIETIRVFVGEIEWKDWRKSIRTIPEIIKEAYHG